MRSRPRKLGQAGYALPAVLTIVTILTLIYMVCILALENLRSETAATVRTAELERAALTAEARFAFLASTEPLGQNALQVGGVRPQAVDILVGRPSAALSPTQVVTPLRIDDQAYLWRETNSPGSGAYVASSQDLAGLINLDRTDQATVLRLLRSLGVKDEAANRIASSFDEYRRPVTLTSQDKANGVLRPIAPNGLMRRYSEIFGVRGLLTDLSNDQRRRFMDLTSIQPDTLTLNINTAPAAVLEAWFNLNAQDAAQIVQRRASETFANLAQIGVAVPNIEGSYTFPSGRFRFSLFSPKAQATYTASIILTPGSFERPFWIENAHVQTLSHPSTLRTDELQPFPSIPDLTATPGRPS